MFCDVLKSEGISTFVPQYLKDYFRSAVGQEAELKDVIISKSKDPEFTRYYTQMLQRYNMDKNICDTNIRRFLRK